MRLSEKDIELLRRAIALAANARRQFNHPFGAVIGRNGKFIAEMADNSTHESDPTMHPEIAIIRQQCKADGTLSTRGLTLYSSCEPCPMCSGAIRYATISRVIFSVSRGTLAGLISKSRSTDLGGHVRCADVVNDGSTRIEIIGPVIQEEGIFVFDGYDFPRKDILRKAWLLHERRLKSERHKL